MFKSFTSLLAFVFVLGLCGCSNEKKYQEMLESSFELSPALRTTLDNLQAEINKWEQERGIFVAMRDAAKTDGGRAAAQAKLSRIESVITNLRGKHDQVLEQVEIIAMEAGATHTELDKSALDDLGQRAGNAMTDARELREALANDSGFDDAGAGSDAYLLYEPGNVESGRVISPGFNE